MDEEITIENTNEGHIEEPIEEPRPPRDIHNLMGLETYQGMTDEEIELIINFRATLIAVGLAAESQAASMATNAETIAAQMELDREQAQRNFERACGMIEFTTVDLKEE